jgi:hypothetical protein
VCFGSHKHLESVLLAKKENRSRTDLGLFRIPKTTRIRSARKGGNRSRTDFGVARIPKTPESIPLVKGGIRAERIWVGFGSQKLTNPLFCSERRAIGAERCFGLQKQSESVLLAKGESEQNRFGCVSDPKNTRIRFVCKARNQGNTD